MGAKRWAALRQRLADAGITPENLVEMRMSILRQMTTFGISGADAENSATIWVWNASSASLVVTESPTGERSEVNTKHDADQRQQWGRVGAAPTNGRNSRKARPMVMVPAANFSGVAGWRWASCVPRGANTRERAMYNSRLV